MSRWRLPRAAARRVERDAKEAANLRKEKRQSVLLVIAIAVISIGLCVADFFWLRYRACQRHEQHHQLHQSGTKLLPSATNPPGNSVPERKP